jgi:hypothetical protein
MAGKQQLSFIPMVLMVVMVLTFTNAAPFYDTMSTSEVHIEIF